MIAVKQLVKRYGEVLALDHFNFDVKRGEIVGLLGPNGSGKTTAINCILSLLSYDKGDIKVLGRELTPTSYDLKKKIGIVPQDIAVLNNLTVKENIDYFCGLYINDKKQRAEYVKQAIAFVNLEDYQNTLFTKLSGGLKRRLNIACGIAHQPEIVFFDEPTVAVDAQSRNFILEGIKSLKQNGTTVVYTTHYLEEVEMLCDRIVIMDKGAAIAQGTLNELQNQISIGEKIVINFTHIDQAQVNKLGELDQLIEVAHTADEVSLTFKKGSKPMRSLVKFIDDNALSYEALYAVKPSLNEVFLALTGRGLRE